LGQATGPALSLHPTGANWGELFCQGAEKNTSVVASHPDYLQSHYDYLYDDDDQGFSNLHVSDRALLGANNRGQLS